MDTRRCSIALLIVAMLLGMAVQAAPKFEEGLHYYPIVPEQPGAKGDKVRVVEFFLYTCPHCYRLEPHLAAWRKKMPANVEFVKIPAMFKRPTLTMHAKTFYALTLMGLEASLSAPIFAAIHEKGMKLKDQGAMEALLGIHGVDLTEYRKAMRSFAVQTQVRRAEVLMNRYGVRGVPTIVIDGKYRTSGLEGEKLMQVTDFLIDEARNAKAAK